MWLMKTKELCNRQCQGTLRSGADRGSVADEWYPGGLAALAENTNKSFRFSRAVPALPHEITSEGTSEVLVRTEDPRPLLLWETPSVPMLGHKHFSMRDVTYRHRFLLPRKASSPYLPLSWLRSLVATPPQGCAYPLPSPTSTGTAEGWQWTGWGAPSPRLGGCTKDHICHILPSPEDERHF